MYSLEKIVYFELKENSIVLNSVQRTRSWKFKLEVNKGEDTEIISL